MYLKLRPPPLKIEHCKVQPTISRCMHCTGIALDLGLSLYGGPSRSALHFFGRSCLASWTSQLKLRFIYHTGNTSMWPRMLHVAHNKLGQAYIIEPSWFEYTMTWSCIDLALPEMHSNWKTQTYGPAWNPYIILIYFGKWKLNNHSSWTDYTIDLATTHLAHGFVVASFGRNLRLFNSGTLTPAKSFRFSWLKFHVAFATV